MKRDAAWTFILLTIAILAGFTSATYAQVVLYGTVTGCQRDAYGAASGPDRPLSGVRVLVGQYMNYETGLTGVDFIRNPKGVSGDTYTNEQGNFTIALPQSGTYEVILWKKGYVTEIKSQVSTGVAFNGSICNNIMAPATHQELAFIGGPRSDGKSALADPGNNADATKTASPSTKRTAATTAVSPSASSGRSESGVAEWAQFHLSYTISGADVEPRETVSTGAVQTYRYAGKLAGNTLTLSGKGWGDVPVSDPNYPWIVTASVSVDGNTKEFEYKAVTPGEKLDKSFSLSVPIPANANSGSISIKVVYHSAYRTQGNAVTGTFTRSRGEVRAPTPPPDSAPPLRAGGEIKPRLIKQVDAVYPEAAQNARVEGVVIVEATTDSEGKVIDARILYSIPLLDDAALTAVKQWIYEPSIIDGKKRGVIFTTTVKFTLK
jgi:TonB family protein